MNSKVEKYGLLLGLVVGLLVGMFSGSFTVWIAVGVALGLLFSHERHQARAEQTQRGSQVPQVRM